MNCPRVYVSLYIAAGAGCRTIPASQFDKQGRLLCYTHYPEELNHAGPHCGAVTNWQQVKRRKPKMGREPKALHVIVTRPCGIRHFEAALDASDLDLRSLVGPTNAKLPSTITELA